MVNQEKLTDFDGTLIYSDMKHIGIFCPPLAGHVQPMAALGAALIQRGHRVTLFQVPGLEKFLHGTGILFQPLGGDSAEVKSILERMGSLSGISSLRFAVQGARRLAEITCLEAPALLRESGVDMLLVDQNEPAGGSVAEHLQIPFLSVAPSLPLNREPAIPPPFVPWSYSPSRAAILRNRIGYAMSNLLISAINRTLNQFRSGWGLRPLASPDDSFSKLAQLFQIPREFDFPRTRLPACVHYLGPFIGTRAPEPSAFPFERLDGRPLIYTSFGTLQAGAMRYFQQIAEGCAALDVQMVIATGSQTASSAPFPENCIVVPWAPQMELLSRAALTITHAGLNTTMQSLYYGVPLLAIPMTHDQPAIGARIAWAGAGICLPPGKASPDRVKQAVTTLLNTSRYRERAHDLKSAIQNAGGVERAADIVDHCMGVRSVAIRNH